jgi:hypothetical protein
MFHVICIETGKPVERESTGEPIELATGADAAEVARLLTTETGRLHQPRRVVASVDWRARERERTRDGSYLPIPDVWTHERWWFVATHECSEWDDATGRYVVRPGRLADHFAHPSTAKDCMVAFTEDDAKGQQDRQTRLTPGRYLTRYFADYLSPPEIAKFAALYCAQFEDIELKVTQDADEIERVYTDGPSSCMSHGACRYESSEHPTRVYAGPDLAIAYIENSQGVTARVVCWPERKVYSRIYGDEVRLEPLLEAAGYRYGSISGARIQRIEDDSSGRFVMPYIDGFSSVSDTGTYFRVDNNGDVECDNTNGLGGQNCDWRCENCEEGQTDDDCSNTVYTRANRAREEQWCDCCVRNHAWTCAGTDDIYSDSVDSVDMANGETWSQRYFEEHGATCEATDTNVPLDDTVTLEDGTIWCTDHFAAHGHQCDRCGCLYDKDDIQCDCTDASEDTPVHIGHVARQGIDKHPNQLDLPIEPPKPSVLVNGHRVSRGDVVWWQVPDTYAPHVPGYFTVTQIDERDTLQPICVSYAYWPQARHIHLTEPALELEYA